MFLLRLDGRGRVSNLGSTAAALLCCEHQSLERRRPAQAMSRGIVYRVRLRSARHARAMSRVWLGAKTERESRTRGLPVSRLEQGCCVDRTSVMNVLAMRRILRGSSERKECIRLFAGTLRGGV